MGAIQRIVDELRRRGVTVHEWAGWQTRGNGTRDLDVKGIILHHTGSAYGSAYPELVSSSQPWADGGALCNFSGNADGSLTVIAAGLTYHAGGGFGPNQGPLAPYAGNRNYHTVGLEIVYPGSQAMKQAQYSTAVTLSRVVVDLFAGGNADYVRAHAEVNGIGYEGKWDPGSGDGTKFIDMNAFRTAVLAWRGHTNPGDDDTEMLSPEAQKWLLDNFLNTGGDRNLIQSMAARTEGLAKTVGTAQNGPDSGETLQGPIDINETKWRVHDLLHLKGVGDRDRVAGEEYPLVALLLRIDERLTAIESRLGGAS